MMVPFFANCGGETPPTPDPEKYDVTCNKGVEVKNPSAIQGEEYITDLVAIDGYIMPSDSTKIKVFIASAESSNYHYSRKSDNEAEFSIDAEYVVGKIDIELNFDAYSVFVTKGAKIEVGKETAIPNTAYATVLSSDGALPRAPTSVKVGDIILTEGYTYSLVENTLSKANFSIDGQYVTGPINIDLSITFTVTVNAAKTIEYKEIAISGSKYQTSFRLPTGSSGTFPSEPTSVKIGNTTLTEEQYDYILEEKSSVAYISIEAQYITGPVYIDLLVGNIYTAEALVSDGSIDLTLSKTSINTLVDYETKISFPADVGDTYHGYRLQDKPTSVTINGSQITDYTYTIDPLRLNEATLKIDKKYLTGAVKIVFATLIANTKWYEFPDWWNYCSTKQGDIPIANEGEIGKIVGVKVNGLLHQVRLIDINHKNAEDAEPEAHCTFEFANVITKSDGEILTTCWNHEDGDISANYHFNLSTLNKFLNDNDDSIFKKLPESLQGAIKEVTKPVAMSEVHTPTLLKYEITPYTTKLFPLSYREISKQTGVVGMQEEGMIYKYYEDYLYEEAIREARIKTALGDDVAQTYWLRSPYTDFGKYAWYVSDGIRGEEDPKPQPGDIRRECVHEGLTLDNQLPVAPAFCI